MTFVLDEKGYGWFPYGTVPYGSGAMTATGGFQVEVTRVFPATGFQATALRATARGFQARVALYNINRLRIMCDFPSRGRRVTTGGNNSWGNPDGAGLNWLASSTEASATNDFDASNLNTDIVEEYWRSAAGVVTGITLDCDTEVTGIFVDTMAMLNCNITSSATINFQAANVSNFGTILFSTSVTPQLDGDNVYISPELPVTQYRYWRIEINDPTNPDGFVRVGTVVFGSAVIFSGECFVDRVSFAKVNYTDSVRTEGQTNVQNDRGIKKKLRLTFRSLDFNLSNFANISDVFTYARTTLKCLWVPTPDYPKRFMVFGKLTQIPEESHNVKGQDSNYVDFDIGVDEAL